MRITLAELELHSITASESYVPGALDFHGAEFRQTTPLKLDAQAELLGSEIRIRGKVATTLEAGCDRCLGPVVIPISRDFDLVYRPLASIAKEEEIEVPADEMEVGFYSGDGIELADVALEQVILSVPMKVICGVECRGLCPVCGANRNLTQCNCAPPEHSSPFASLKEE
ncbi:MAG TPA: DUF177 domain-containing protein [Terriglobia bacterium]|nr:DUF177 domain-containing protein [Terriglobia bacterium]